MIKLNKNRGILVLLLVLLVACSFLGTIRWENNASAMEGLARKIPVASLAYQARYDLLTFPCFTFSFPVLPLPSTESISVADNNIVDFSNSNRTRIYDFVLSNPGVQFRGICNALCLAVGTAEFHLGVLKKAGLISFFRDGRYKRFFESKKYTSRQMEIISLMRHDTVTAIFKLLLDKGTMSHGQLAVHVSITSQGLTWQMHRLTSTGIIVESRVEKGVFYAIDANENKFVSETISALSSR